MKKKTALASLLLIGIAGSGYYFFNGSYATEKSLNEQVTVHYGDVPEKKQAEFVPHFTAVSVPENLKQHKTISTKKKETILGTSGTILVIPENAFVNKRGESISGNVNIELVEGIATADILKMNLGTMSEQGMLETGGMIFLGATAMNGDTLSLATGKAIDAEIPTTQKKPGMQLWEGKKQADGTLLWANPKPLDDGLRTVPAETLAEKKDEVKSSEKTNTQSMIVVSKFGDERFAHNDTNGYFAISASAGNAEYISFADKKFEGTNIATVEFRSRLPIIRQACDTRIVRCYAENPKRALWQSDAAAADSLEKWGCPLAAVFREFAKLKQANCDPKDPTVAALLDKAREAAVANYTKAVLEQNQKNNFAFGRTEAYSFRMTTLGWANCDALYGGANTKMAAFNTRVEGGGENISTQLIVPGRNIFIPGFRRPNGDYAYTHGENEKMMSCPSGEKGYILVKSGKDRNFRYALQAFVFGERELEVVRLSPGTEQQLDATMAALFSQKDRVIDDWYTKQIRAGNGCACNTGWAGASK